MIPQDLLEILRCVHCGSELDADDDDELTCRGCGVRYPIEDGVPNMLPDAARPPRG